MRRFVAVLLAFATAVVLGCATPAPASAPPQAPDGMGGIGIRVDVGAMLGQTISAETVFFARLDAPSGAPEATRLYASNFRRDGRVYLLGVPPGRYAAVAALRSELVLTTKDSRLAYFPQSLIDLTEVSIIPGAVAYAGSHVIGIGMPGVCASDSDAAQLRHAEMLGPGVPKCGLMRIVLHDLATSPLMVVNGSVFTLGDKVYHHRASLRESNRQAADQDEFIARARQDLAATGWTIGTR
ncbi:MAG: hypothetical protein OEU94_03780 [Aquincola sp.]|nr:hypothetical protein [Aquincola sp.]